MRRLARTAQVFIHQHYESIKLVLLVIILALVGYAVLGTIVANADANRQRGESVIRIVESIERETDEQTRIINRQFQALCFLLIETSGERALKQLDPPLDQQCRNLAAELREDERERRDEAQSQVSAPSQASQPMPSSPTPVPARAPSSASQPQPARLEPQPREEPVTPEPPTLLERVTQPLNDLFKLFKGVM